MSFFMKLSNMVKGILLIVGGVIVLLNTLGIATATLNTLVLLGAIGMIVLGIYLSGAYQKMYALLTEEKKSNIP